MAAAAREQGWVETAAQIRTELAALRAAFRAGWAVIWGPMPLRPRAPFACVLFEDRDPDCASALGIAVPLIANPWADEIFARGGAVSLDAASDARLRLTARVLARNRVTAIASGAFQREGETRCVAEVYARGPLSLPPDPIGVLAASAERVAGILERGRRAAACALDPPDPSDAPTVSAAPVDPMTASALHDLKNALAAQSLLISSMEKELRAAAAGATPGGALLDSLAVLRDSVQHASELTRVMTLGTIAPGARSAIDLPGLARLSLAAVPSELRERFTVDADPALVGAGIVREAPALLRAMVSLVQNAALAIQRDPAARATVRVRTEDELAVIEVDDEGPGVSSEVLDRLFEPGVTTRERPDGHGFGLHATRAIVEAIGGTIALYSIPGRGARFTVRVPRAAAGLG